LRRGLLANVAGGTVPTARPAPFARRIDLFLFGSVVHALDPTLPILVLLAATTGGMLLLAAWASRLGSATTRHEPLAAGAQPVAILESTASRPLWLIALSAEALRREPSPRVTDPMVPWMQPTLPLGKLAAVTSRVLGHIGILRAHCAPGFRAPTAPSPIAGWPDPDRPSKDRFARCTSTKLSDRSAG